MWKIFVDRYPALPLVVLIHDLTEGFMSKIKKSAWAIRELIDGFNFLKFNSTKKIKIVEICLYLKRSRLLLKNIQLNDPCVSLLSLPSIVASRRLEVADAPHPLQ